MPPIKRAGDAEGPHASQPARPDNQDSGAAVSSAKKKTSGSTRTGQACDRCKVRKIRCDARPGGCSPCMQANAECKTTDRITGRATSRGHTENLEHENVNLKLYVVELQAQLKELGHEPKPQPPASHSYPSGAAYWSQQELPIRAQASQHSPGAGWYGATGSSLPDFRRGLVGDNYLGVTFDSGVLSPIHGTSLTFFSAKIDIADFMPPEPHPDASAMSYETFLQYAFGGKQAPRPQLPGYEEFKQFADWWFRSVTPFLPIIHRPDFMQLLVRIYHERYQPSPAETVMVHIVYGQLLFQSGTRNLSAAQSVSAAFTHYHYALTMISQLIKGHQLEDMQALALICAFLRGLPRPGPAWMFVDFVMTLAIEIGLHRSSKAWPMLAAEDDEHTVELRKRVFWSLLTIHVSISGKLGRPMRLRMDDFDIEFPEAVNDNLPGETTNMTKWKKCSYRTAIHGFKLVRIIMQVYAILYAVRTTEGQHDVNVRRIEMELQAFESQVPPELSYGPQTREEDRVHALYLKLTQAACELQLYHPAVNRSSAPQAANESVDASLQASEKILFCAIELKKILALDTTWYYGTDFLAAIFTTLYIYWWRRDSVTTEQMQKLRADMENWLDVMGSLGGLLGTGPKLQQAVRKIVDEALAELSTYLAKKAASSAMVSSPPPALHGQQTQQQSYAAGTYYQAQTSSYHATSPPQPGYPPDSHYAYAGPQATPVPQQYTSAFDASAYGPEDIKPSLEGQLAHPPAPPPPLMATFQQQPHQVYPQPSASVMAGPAGLQGSGQAAWRQFMDPITHNLGAQQHEYMVSAASGIMATTAAPVNVLGLLPEGPQQWPMIHYQHLPPSDTSMP